MTRAGPPPASSSSTAPRSAPGSPPPPPPPPLSLSLPSPHPLGAGALRPFDGRAGRRIARDGDRGHPHVPGRRPGDRPPWLRRIVWVGGIAAALAVNCRCSHRASPGRPRPFHARLLGAAQDVAMNSHGVKVEEDLGRPIMSSLHAGWAFGGMAGAGFAAGVRRARGRCASERGNRLGAAARAAVACASGSDTARAPLATMRPASRSLARHRAAGDPVLARDDHRGRDGRLGRALSARGPRRQRRNRRAPLRVLHRRHDDRTRRRRPVNKRIGPVALLRWGALLDRRPARRDAAVGSRPWRWSACSSSASASRTGCH